MHHRFLIVFITMMFVGIASAASNIKSGEWTATLELTGMPVPLPPQNFKYCVDKNNVIPMRKQSTDCKVDHKLENNILTWTVDCKNGNQGKGEVTYQFDKMSGATRFSSTEHQMVMDSTINGKWTSANCSKDVINK